MTPRSSSLTALLCLITGLGTACAHALREPAAKACAHATVSVEHCKRGSCANASMKNTHGEEWATIEEWQRQADEVCALSKAIEAGRLGR